MYKLVKGLLVLSSFALLFSCKEESKDGIKATVLYSDEVIVSEITPQQLKPIDTLLITERVFSYSPDVTAPVFLLFEFPSGSRIPVLYKPGEQIELAINDTAEFGTFTATGSVSADRMARQRDLFVATARFFDSINYVNALYTDSANFADVRAGLNDALRNRLDEHRVALEAIIDEDTTDLANIMAFYQSLGRIEFFNVDRDILYYEKVDRGLQATHPENEHAKYFHQRLDEYKSAKVRQMMIQAAAQRVVEGSQAPEISLPNPDGEVLHLSDLRGKIVLIDFWASWCGPCRRANPELVAIYDKFNARGFEIFSVSLDGIPSQPNAQNDWRFAIEKDDLHWPNHVSDLQGYNSIVAEQYGFDGIPFTVLLDRDGKIIARNLRGQALADKLAEIF